MGKLELIYSLSLLVGIVASRITLIGARGGVTHRSVVSAFIGMVATFVTLSLILWGFAALSWYWPIVVFIAGSIIAGLLITRENWGSWFAVAPGLELAAAAGGLYLWIWHWPF